MVWQTISLVNNFLERQFMRKIILVFIASACLSCTNKEKIHYKDYTSLWDTVRVLHNPGKGWYHHLLDNGIDKYKIRNDSIFLSFPAMDHLYLRLAWSYLEPQEGKYNWLVIDSIIDRYVPLGFGISFRITSKETGKFPNAVNQEFNNIQYATPYWVKKAGAKGTITEMWGIKSWVPHWDDPVYLEKLNKFHNAFAKRYDGKPWIRYIDIGSIGEWGEGHTSFSTKIPPTLEEVKANIDVFLKNYKKSQLICTDDLLYYGKDEKNVNSLLDYTLTNGISLRDDSPMVNWYLQQNLNTWSVSHPYFYDPLYLSKPVVFELQHYGIVKRDSNWLGKNGEGTIARYGHSGAEIMRKAIETMHATYIGYHGYAEEWITDNPDLTNQLANLCGSDNSDFYTSCFGTEWFSYIKSVILNLVKQHGLAYAKLDLSVVTSAYVNDPVISGCYASEHPYHRDHEESFIVIYQNVLKLFDELHVEAPELFIDCTFETAGKLQLQDYAFIRHAEGNWLSNIEEPFPTGALRMRQLAWWRSPALPAGSLVIGNLLKVHGMDGHE